MPVYVFSCGECGQFELPRPMAEAGSAAHCPVCLRAARRVFTAPGLGKGSTAVRRALEAADASAHEPRVVRRTAGRSRPRRRSPAPPWVVP